jgi:membrane-bound metal-dependent hydrolase YbcI (DUF457 family)
MFLGHFAVGFAAKRAMPRASLGTMIAAACFLDLLWPILVLAGIEWFRIVPGETVMTPMAFDHYPWSHSLLMSVVWGLLFGAFVAKWGSGIRAGMFAGLAVVSHWVLDYVTHRPDLPLAPWGSLKAGLGLWNSPRLEIPLELGLYIAGVALYVTGTRSRDRVGSIGLWSFVVVLTLLFAANLASPPPPGPQAVTVFGVVAILLLVWPMWVDRHRVSRVGSP